MITFRGVLVESEGEWKEVHRFCIHGISRGLQDQAEKLGRKDCTGAGDPLLRWGRIVSLRLQCLPCLFSHYENFLGFGMV